MCLIRKPINPRENQKDTNSKLRTGKQIGEAELEWKIMVEEGDEELDNNDE